NLTGFDGLIDHFLQVVRELGDDGVVGNIQRTDTNNGTAWRGPQLARFLLLSIARRSGWLSLCSLVHRSLLWHGVTPLRCHAPWIMLDYASAVNVSIASYVYSTS